MYTIITSLGQQGFCFPAGNMELAQLTLSLSVMLFLECEQLDMFMSFCHLS